MYEQIPREQRADEGLYLSGIQLPPLCDASHSPGQDGREVCIAWHAQEPRTVLSTEWVKKSPHRPTGQTANPDLGPQSLESSFSALAGLSKAGGQAPCEQAT